VPSPLVISLGIISIAAAIALGVALYRLGRVDGR
jgi:hypothetical protein